ncbi:hypothetical protein TH61_10775 [Rufibacter sp. DG15C]|uniref:SusD/RagB family nutrient-binding outer membrane lipoprotein n=1 Tax=Rufibacter sp. DG15C TaxID=1379909 RepID=UPI00078B638C|nr:SusD/RagB family nutrient-binding outer membrane lipoprotein [Rufibacter sp. DG15C]AMM51561.1 hypothetical protein TH61_10775 [Rufibacter sp. DG15C]
MKKIVYVLLSLALAQSVVSCDTVDFGDMNENPNGPQEVYPAGLLSGAMQTFATQTGREGFLNPTLYVQYQSQITYTDEMLYAESPASWANYYTRILPNLNTVIEFNMNEANHSPALLNQGDPANQAGIAMIFRAIVLKRLTDTWGDVPYSEAFKGLENLTPAYDSQEKIYQAIIKDLTTGRDMLNSGRAPIGDLYYNGNVTNWRKLANSVLLQVAMQLSGVDSKTSIDAVAVFNEALTNPGGVIDEVSEEAWFKYESVAAYQNPFAPNRRADYGLSGEFVDAFQGDAGLNPTSNRTVDDRLKVFATSATIEGIPYGYANETGAGRSKVNANYVWNATASLPLMTASYTYLNRAEAAQRGWTNEVAATMLRKGIELSFESWETKSIDKARTLTAAEVTKISNISEAGPAYATARLADALTVPGGMLQVIAEEKWKALFPNAFDAWAEWRRTGYPNLQPATDALNDGKIVTRYIYPTNESTLNRDGLAGGIKGLTPATNTNTSRVWWDVN